MRRLSKHSSEIRERAVRMVFEHTPEHSSQWAAIRSVGEKLGIRTESWRRWVRQAERDTGERPGATTSEREELKRLQRENFELKRATDLAPTFTKVAQELHSQYVIGFAPTALDNKVHKLAVRMKQPGMTAQARRSYLAAGDKMSVSGK